MRRKEIGSHCWRFAFWTMAKLALLWVAGHAFAHAQAATGGGGQLQLRAASTGAFIAAANELTPRCQRERQVEVKLETGGSAGTDPTSIPVWLDRGELFDLVIVSDGSLDELIRKGKVLPGSAVDLVRSDIGLAFKAGAQKPDIHDAEALKQTLLAARSIAYSAGVSGVYVRDIMFPKLGIADQMKPKTLLIQEVGEAIASGKAEFGFQQVSELLPIKGVDFLHLPRDAAELSIFSAGIPVNAPHPKEAREFIEWLASPAASDAIRESGLEPVNSK